MSIRQGNNIIAGNSDNKKSNAYMTNCITEIPQDIKLELNDGTLTLKAGSKLYVPNGFEQDGTTPKFDVVITNTDITPTGWANLTGVIVIKNNGSGYNFTGLSQCTSGTTEAAHSDGNLWYDTANNLMKRWDGASVTTWTTGYSLPIAIVTFLTFSSVKSLSVIARQPSVPNLIFAICSLFLV